jgi:hypothetical protein
MRSSPLVFIFSAFVALSIGSPRAQELRNTGLNFIDESTYRSIPFAATPLLGNVPAEVDLSNKFPRPGYQGAQASCVGWAVSYLKAYQEGVERRWSLSDTSHQFSPAFIYNQIRTAQNCMGGTNFTDALTLVRRDGAATLLDFPYDEHSCSRLPDAGIKQRAREYAIADWRRVNVQDEIEVKTQIASGFPVLIGMIVDDVFSQLGGEQIYNRPAGPSRGGHAMVVVGYSDSRHAFKVINSWGTNWGNNGFGWIEYTTFRQIVREAYTAQDIIINRPEPVGPGPVTPPVTATVNIGAPIITHNVPVRTPTGFQSGMQIQVPGQVTGAAGRTMQVVVKFNYLNGPPLHANPAEPVYRDSGGLVATGTQAISVATNSESTNPLQISIPYYALNFQPTGGNIVLNLSLIAIAFIDNEQKAQSPQIPFVLRW